MLEIVLTTSHNFSQFYFIFHCNSLTTLIVFFVCFSPQYPSFQAERSDSDQDSLWRGSPLTDTTSPQMQETNEGTDASCVYKHFTDPGPLCYSVSEEQHHSGDGHKHVHGHAQGQSCERGRCEAGRYFLGAPPPSRDTWWSTTRAILPLSKVSLENREGCDGSMPHITAVHSYDGKSYTLTCITV